MSLIILVVILILSIIALVIAVSIILGLIITGGIPFISTDKKNFKKILESVSLKEGEKIYDLGCGKAHLLIYAAKKFGAKGIGYELALWPYYWAKIKIFLTKVNVIVKNKNFFSANLSHADVVFCYLFPKVMKKLEPKFEAELLPGSRVVSYGFKLPNKIPTEEIITNNNNTDLGKIYVYRY